MWGQTDPAGFGPRDPAGFGKPSGMAKGGKPMHSVGPGFGKGGGFKGDKSMAMKGGEPAEDPDVWDEQPEEEADADDTGGLGGGPVTVRPPMWKGKGKDEPQDDSQKGGNQPCFGKGAIPAFGKGKTVRPPSFGGKGEDDAGDTKGEGKGKPVWFGKGKKGSDEAEEDSAPSVVKPFFGKGKKISDETEENHSGPSVVSPWKGKGKKSWNEAEEESGPSPPKGKGKKAPEAAEEESGPSVVKPPSWKGKGGKDKSGMDDNQEEEDMDDGSAVPVPPPKGKAAKGGGKKGKPGKENSWEAGDNQSWEDAETAEDAEEQQEDEEEQEWNNSWKKHGEDDEDAEEDEWNDWQEDEEEEWGGEGEGDDEGDEEEWGNEEGGEADEEWGEGQEEEAWGGEDEQMQEEEGDESTVVMHFSPPCFVKIIGRAGGAINKVRQESGAEVTIKKTVRSVEVTISGDPAAVASAKESVIGLAEEDPDPSLAEPEEEEDEIEEVKLLIDGSCLPLLLGTGGENIKNVREETGADIIVKQVAGKDGAHKGKVKMMLDVFITGTKDQVAFAKTMLSETVGPSFVDRTPGANSTAKVIAPPPKAPPPPDKPMMMPPDGFGTLTLNFEIGAAGRIIGAGGENIRKLRTETDAYVRVNKLEEEGKCEVVITGQVAKVQAAMKALIELTAQFNFTPEFRGFVTQEGNEGKGKGKKGYAGGGDLVEFDKDMAGHILGVAGKKVDEARKSSGAEIIVTKMGLNLELSLSGNPGAVQIAKAALEKLSTDGKNRSWGNKNWTNVRDENEDEDEYNTHIPRQDAMKIIGYKGSTCKRIRYESGAYISANIDGETDEGCPLVIRGTLEAVDAARTMIMDIVRSEIRDGADVEWEDEDYIRVSQQESRRLIGKQGSTATQIRKATSTKMIVDQGDRSDATLVTVRIAGALANVKRARTIIEELLGGKRLDDVLEEDTNNNWKQNRGYRDYGRDRDYGRRGYDNYDDRRSKGKDRGKGKSKGKDRDRDGKGKKGKKGKGKKRRRDD